jgi:chromosome partitioning protein
MDDWMTGIISVLNFKGGTGKTTTVLNLAAGLALRGARVLCIDMDAQGSLTTCLGVRHPFTLTDLLLGRSSTEACIASARRNLDLIPGDGSLMRAEGELWRKNGNGTGKPLRFLSDHLDCISGYDYVILDHSPSVSLLSENGLCYAEELIIPVSMSYLALIGTRQVLQTLRSFDKGCRLFLILPTFYDARQRQDREVLQILERHFGRVLAEPIRINISLAEAMGQQKNIYEYAPKSTGAVDYARLVERVAGYG